MKVDKKKIGYILVGYGFLSLILLMRNGIVFLFLFSIAILIYGGILLYQEDPKIKEFLKSKKNSSVSNNSLKSPNFENVKTSDNKLPLIPLIASFLMLISVFMPWVKGVFSGGYGGAQRSMNTPSLTGMEYDKNGTMVLIILIALAAGFMAFKQIQFSFIAGAVNLLLAIAYFMEWLGKAKSMSMNNIGIKADVSYVAQFGLYLLLIASITYIITTIKFFKTTNT